MRAAHRRVHVVLWVLVTVAAVAIIAFAWRTRPGEPPRGPSASTEVAP